MSAPGSPRPGDPRPVDDADLRRVAAAPYLLVVSDFDGVLAPFVDDPRDAAAVPESMAALERLAGLPATTVALVSGRGRDDLAARSGASTAVVFVGGHGGEWAEGSTVELTEDDRRRHAELIAELEAIARDVPGSSVETKTSSAALHYRTVPEPADRERARRAALEGPGSRDDLFVTAGKNVVEIAVVEANKGTALLELAERVRAGGGRPVTVFCGDDVTDERGFAVLGEHDLSVKVGEGETLARRRVADIPAVTRLYGRLAELRAAHLGG